jgi:peptidoglycan hydrolase-like protein with peptidoglycan-binding domain
MTIPGIDSADHAIPASVLTKHHVEFFAGYVSNAGNRKNMTATECTERGRAGVRTVTIFETTAERAMSGRPGGLVDARSAGEQAHAIGQPFGSPIYYGVDFNPTEPDLNMIIDYFDGLVEASVHYYVGGYGGYATVAKLHRNNAVKYLMQTAAWSDGRWFDSVDIRQTKNGVNLDGHGVDLDTAMVADYGGWIPTTVITPPAPRPAPRPAPTSDWTTAMVTSLPTLQDGAHDPISGQPAVHRMQSLIIGGAHYTVGAAGVDGIYGPATIAAVRNVQHDHGLTVDGVCGPHTWSVLVTGHDL